MNILCSNIEKIIICMLSKSISLSMDHIKKGRLGMKVGVGQWRDTCTFKTELQPCSLNLPHLQLQYSIALSALPSPSSSITQFTLMHCWMPTHPPGLELSLCFPHTGLLLFPRQSYLLLEVSFHRFPDFLLLQPHLLVYFY